MPEIRLLHGRRIRVSKRAVVFAGLFLCVAWAPAPARGGQGRTDFKFQFAPGKVQPGWTQVSPAAFYSDAAGYGFESGAKIQALARGGDDALRSGLCTSETPFFFSVALPEGNYKVTVTLGDAAGESVTTVKAELRRLMLESVATAAGKFETRSFVVNVRTSNIAGGGRVKLKVPRETEGEAWAWDSRLTLEFNDRRPCLCALEIRKEDVPTVFLLGDSTVCDQAKEPYASWGQMLPRFFAPDVAVANHAQSGETLRSSAHANRLAKVLGEVKKGDTVLIQYGHNDMKSTAADASAQYKATLLQWVRQIRQKGGTPVLVTSMHRCRFEGNSVVNTLRDYPDKVREAAAEEKVALIDLHAMSKSLYEALGPRNAIVAFKHESLTDSNFDRTHHSPYGAYELARCVVEGIRQAKLDLAAHIAEDVPRFDPARPDDPKSFRVPSSPGLAAQRPLGD